MNTVDRAQGRWHEILPYLGIDARFLVNRHGPCPLCGGRDRFRFDNKNGNGSYYCNQCGPGSGIVLVRKRHGWDYAKACRAIDEIIGQAPPPPHREPERGRQTDADRIERLLADANDYRIVEQYLTGRGLRTFPAMLRGHPRVTYTEADGTFVGRFPAMLAPVLGPDGELRSIHRTYVAHVPTRKKLLSSVGAGAAIRLFDPTEYLGIAEGIETAVAAHELFAVPTWATIATSIMDLFTPPTGIERLLIFADNDSNFAGQKCAYNLANRLVRERPDLAIEVLVPQEPDSDWLNVLNQGTRPG